MTTRTYAAGDAAAVGLADCSRVRNPRNSAETVPHAASSFAGRYGLSASTSSPNDTGHQSSRMNRLVLHAAAAELTTATQARQCTST